MGALSEAESVRRRLRRVALTDRDLTLLEFVAEQQLVLATQLAVVTGAAPSALRGRLRALSDGGYLRREQQLHRQPPCFQITAAGLRAAGSDLPSPRKVNLAHYRHDVGTGWLMLAAQRGRFGPVAEIASERRMRSVDLAAERAADGAGPRVRFGVRLGGFGPGGRERLHYPDLLVVTQSGHRIAFELELTSKAPTSRERILAAYAADPGIDRVVYLVDKPSTGRAIAESAARLGISDVVRVQDVRLGDDPNPPVGGRSATRRHGRPDAEPELAR